MSRRIALGFVVMLLLIAAGFGVSFYNYSQYNTANKRVRDVYKVISTLDRALSLMKDAETGVRGYVISGDDPFLEPNTTARSQLPDCIRELRVLLAGSAIQQQQTDVLARLIDAKLAIGDRQIQARRNNQAVGQYLLVGKVRMDRVRRQVVRMVATQQRSIQTRESGVYDSFQNMLLVTLLLSVLTFATLVILYTLLQAELNRRQKNEDQLRAYEEDLKDQIRQLGASNQELERFAFVASHDLQEPLRKIQSLGSLLAQRHETLLTEEAATLLSKIVRSAGRMSELIRDLFNFSRITTREEGFRPVQVSKIVQRVLDDQEPRIQALSAIIHVEPLPTIQAVPSQVSHLFTNLIANALKFTQPGVVPVVHIRAETVDGGRYPELIPGREYHQIIVTDNGIGFDEKHLNHIFEVFQRLHNTNTYEGTGIGLAICKKVVMHHKGYITARSRPGEGASFVVVLPERQKSELHDRTTPDKAYSYTAG